MPIDKSDQIKLFEENPHKEELRAAARSNEVSFTQNALAINPDNSMSHVDPDGTHTITFGAADRMHLAVTSPVDDWLRALPSVVEKLSRPATVEIGPIVEEHNPELVRVSELQAAIAEHREPKRGVTSYSRKAVIRYER